LAFFVGVEGIDHQMPSIQEASSPKTDIIFHGYYDFHCSSSLVAYALPHFGDDAEASPTQVKSIIGPCHEASRNSKNHIPDIFFTISTFFLHCTYV
jgi:hypothetical protein